jgi:hypothetical protein
MMGWFIVSETLDGTIAMETVVCIDDREKIIPPSRRQVAMAPKISLRS